MAYTPINTFTNGTILEAADIRENNDELQAYLSTGIAVSDLATDNWVDTKHIMRGTFSPYENKMLFVSGSNTVQSYYVPNDPPSYLSKYNTKRQSSATNYPRSFIPQTSMYIEIPRDSSLVLIEYDVWTASDDSGSGSYNMSEFNIAWKATDLTLDDINNNAGIQGRTLGYATEERDSTAITGGWAQRALSRPYHGFFVVDGVDAGIYTAALIGRSEYPKCALFSWQMSIEVWY